MRARTTIDLTNNITIEDKVAVEEIDDPERELPAAIKLHTILYYKDSIRKGGEPPSVLEPGTEPEEDGARQPLSLDALGTPAEHEDDVDAEEEMDFSYMYPGYKEWTITTTEARSLQAQSPGGPKWSQVFARTTRDNDTGEYLELNRPTASIPRQGRRRDIGEPRNLTTTLYLPRSAKADIKPPDRRRRRPDKLRSEKGDKHLATEPLPVEHYETHFPKDDRCIHCRRAKMRKAEATVSANFAEGAISSLTSPMQIVSGDICTARTADRKGNRLMLAYRDEKTGVRKADSQPDREAWSTWVNTENLYPGSRLTGGDVQTFPETFTLDGDTAFEGIYEAKVKERGGKILTSIPGRSKSNAKGERNVGEIERGAAVALDTSGGPMICWSDSVHVFCHNDARVTPQEDGESGYKMQYGKEHTDQVLPFGCFVDYFDDEHDKYARRSKPGVFLRYAPHNSILVADLCDLKERIFSIVRTRDFQANRTEYPMREIDWGEDSFDYEAFELRRNDEDEELEEEPDTYTDKKGHKRCGRCSKVMSDDPITCKPCLEPEAHKHPRGRNRDPNCRRNRCPGHRSKNDTDGKEDDNDDDDDDGPPNVFGSRRRRMRGKQPNVPPSVPATPMLPSAVERAVVSPEVEVHMPMLGMSRSMQERAAGYAMSMSQKKRMDRMLREQEEREVKEKIIYDKELHRIARSIGMVTRVLRQNSSEVRDDPKAQQSLRDELLQMVGKGVFNPSRVREWSSVAAEDSTARRVDAIMITAIKNEEDEEMRKHKSRLVANGANLRGVKGEKIEEDLMHVVPTSLTGIRTCASYSLTVRAGKTYRGDVRGAYLTSRISGPPVWLSLAKKYWLPEWNLPDNMADPVIPLDQSMYGLQRGDIDWGTRARREMKDMTFERIIDYGEDSVWKRRVTKKYLAELHAKGMFTPEEEQELKFGPEDPEPEPVLVYLYSDDFIVGGHGPASRAAHVELNKRLGFSDAPTYAFREIVGLKYIEYKPDENGTRSALFHQNEYITYVVDKYKAEHFGGKDLRKTSSPMWTREARDKEHSAGIAEGTVPEWVPYLKEAAAKLGGQVLWIARGCRPDIMATAHRLTARLSKWERPDDYAMHRLFSYLASTPTLGVLLKANPKDINNFVLDEYSDSDHNSDPASAKSTTGAIVIVTGPHGTWLPLGWMSRKQTGVGLSTPDAETAAKSESVFHLAIPLLGLLCEAYGRDIRMCSWGDNDTSLKAIRKGYSRRMAYLPKTQRVSIGALHLWYFGEDNIELVQDDDFSIHRLCKVHTDVNVSDILTKPLEPDRHWFLVKLLGMASAAAA